MQKKLQNLHQTLTAMDQPKVERLLRLIQLLSSNVEYSIDDLMERLGMSRRTIYRYLDTFKEAGFAQTDVAKDFYDKNRFIFYTK